MSILHPLRSETFCPLRRRPKQSLFRWGHYFLINSYAITESNQKEIEATAKHFWTRRIGENIFSPINGLWPCW